MRGGKVHEGRDILEEGNCTAYSKLQLATCCTSLMCSLLISFLIGLLVVD